MSCSNCFNGCAEIVSDKCVRYTGNSIPALEIETGDTLLSIENAITNFIATAINGTGILPTIAPSTLCPIVSAYLPTSGTIDLNEYITAMIKATCAIKIQADASTTAITALNSNYSIECLSGVTSSSDTHEIVQAVITKLCAVDASVAALALDVSTNYVKLADLNTLIQAYLDSIPDNPENPTNTLYYTKMVPYTVVEYYGDLAPFDGTGKGTGDWIYINLCNGLNGTPDKRGRYAVGAIGDVPPGIPLDPSVDPFSNPANPNYIKNSTGGNSSVTLTTAQIPAHNHTTSTAITDPGHRHDILGITGGDDDNNNNTVRFAGGDKNQGETAFYFTNTQACQTSFTGLNSSNVAVTVNNSGGGGPHPNLPPYRACYYIMYVPAP